MGEKEDKEVNKHNSWLAGGVAGSVGKTVTAPLSRLTILYQVSPVLSSNSVTINRSTSIPLNVKQQEIVIKGSLYDVCLKVIREEGFKSFWKGNLTSILHRFPYSAINFSVYEMSKPIVVKRITAKKETPTVRLICGAISGAAACVACYPLDLIRTRLTVMQKPGIQSNSIFKTLFNIIKFEGIGGLYRGLTVSLVVSVPNLAIGFSAYGTGKEYLLKQDNNMYANNGHLTPIGALLCGSFSGITSSLIVFPADVVRRRMQVRGIVKNKLDNSIVKKPTALEESIKIFKHEGIKGMYRGILPEILKVTPMVGITFCTYELIMDLLG